jgi:transcriptional regulator with XRE-family HTH domain
MDYITGNRINAILYEKNMTRAELIDKLGIDPSFMAKIINNKKKNLNVTTAMKISRALDYPIDVVFIFD